MAFTNKMIEIDTFSTVSCITSVFDGTSGRDIEELRAFRRSLNSDRRKLAKEHARILLLDEIDFESDAPAFDDWLEMWFENVNKYVNAAKEKLAAAAITHKTMELVFDSLSPMRMFWKTTRFLTGEKWNLRYPISAFPSSSFSASTGL